MSRAPQVFVRSNFGEPWRQLVADGASLPVTEAMGREITALCLEAVDSDPSYAENFANRLSLIRFRGKLVFHNTMGPAYEMSAGTTIWFENGKKHRSGDLPAVERPDGEKHWYHRGRAHRDGGQPASIYPTMNAWAWHENGKSHRVDGPATLGDGGLLHWAHRGTGYDDWMSLLQEDLRRGGVVIDRMPDCRPSSPAGWFQLVTVAGEVASQPLSVPSAGWLDWIEVNAETYAPELAAAMRAKAMHQAVAAAPTQTAQPVDQANRKVRRSTVI